MKVYLTRRQADMTEGRGGMINDLVFLHREHAARYIDGKPGVMGHRAKWSDQPYGSWDILELDVLDFDVVAEEEYRETIAQEAMKKLTNEEIEALGLKKKK